MHGYLTVVSLVHDIRDLCAESVRRQARGNQRALLGQRDPECCADVMLLMLLNLGEDLECRAHVICRTVCRGGLGKRYRRPRGRQPNFKFPFAAEWRSPFPIPAPPIDGRQSNAATRTETRRFNVMQKIKGLYESWVVESQILQANSICGK